VQIPDASHLSATILDLLNDEERRTTMGERARRAVLANTGALEKSLTLLEPLLPPRHHHTSAPS
ncbi:MAG: 3-deoxy-D-manno-octulosonic acid transferase, partial [Magnetococcales bacterium]|nr:3-deoxy-D-manno-octulosonic acid transferase [Magnetococcales bacterium]